MRGFIQFCAGLFIIAGALVVVVFGILAAFMVSAGSSVPGMAGAASLLVAAGGLISGASIVLVGGGTYLLASIDRRLETAGRKNSAPNSERAAAGEATPAYSG